MCFLRDSVCVSVFSYLSRSTCVCGGPCPWGLLFWFNGAPHGWAQSDTSDPVKGDARWSWSYTTAAPPRKDGLVLRRCLHVLTLLTPVETTENLDFKCLNKDILARHEAVLLNCLIVAAGAETYFTFGKKTTSSYVVFYFKYWPSVEDFSHDWSVWESRLRLKINPLPLIYFFSCRATFKWDDPDVFLNRQRVEHRDHIIQKSE